MFLTAVALALTQATHYFIENDTVSPSGKFALAWHTPTMNILSTTESSELRTSGDAESFKLELINPKTLDPIATTKGASKFGYFNHLNSVTALYTTSEDLVAVTETNDWGVVAFDVIDTNTGKVSDLFKDLSKAVQMEAIREGGYSHQEAKGLAFDATPKLNNGLITLSGKAEIPKGNDPHNGMSMYVEYKVVKAKGSLTLKRSAVGKSG